VNNDYLWEIADSGTAWELFHLEELSDEFYGDVCYVTCWDCYKLIEWGFTLER